MSLTANNTSNQEVFTGFTTTKTVGESYTITHNGTSRVTKIGSGTTGNFVPKLTFGAWDECQIELTLDTNLTGAIRNAIIQNPDGSLTVSNSNFAFYYKPVPIKEGFNDMGGIDFKLTVNKNPKTNVLPFTYNSTLVNAYFQPPLTFEYATGWNDKFQCNIVVTETEVTNVSTNEILVSRPDYVINSIAFYHQSKAGNYLALGGKDYKVGKIGHLYRMKATDSSVTPKVTWANWSLSGSNINLTVDQTYLNTATYPVTIAPVGDTLGYTSEGKTLTPCPVDDIDSDLYTATADGTVSSVSAFVKKNSTSAYFKGLLLTHADLKLIANGVGGACSVQITDTTTPHWHTSTFATPPNITNGTAYLIGLIPNYGIHEYSDAQTGIEHYDASNSYTTPADMGTCATYNYVLSIYCTYTPAASYDITNDPSTKAFGIVAASTSYYAKGTAPNNPVVDGDCTYTLTSTGSGATDVDIHGHNSTGGAGMSITSSAPSANEYRITAYKTGDNPASGVVLTTSDQELYDNLASSGHFHWDYKFETGSSFTLGNEQTTTIDVTGRAHT